MKLSAITIFEYKKMLLSGKWSMPLILLIAYLAMTYTMAPAGVLNTFSVSSYVFFLIMLSFSILADSIDAEMINQSILAKCREHIETFYLAKLLAIFIYTIIGSGIAMLVPVIRYIISGTNFFIRPVSIADVAIGLILHILLGMTGAVFGLILNSRVIKKRQVAVGIAVLFGIICIVKDAIISDFHLLQYLLWILPPVSNIVKKFGEASFFNSSLLPLIAWGIVYLLIEIIIYVRSMKKLKFL